MGFFSVPTVVSRPASFRTSSPTLLSRSSFSPQTRSTTYRVPQSRVLDSANNRRHPIHEYPDLGAIPPAGRIRDIHGMRIGTPVHKNRHELPSFDERPHHEIHGMNDAQTAQRGCKMSVAFTNEHVVAWTFQRDSLPRRNWSGCTIPVFAEKYPTTGMFLSSISRGCWGTPCLAR
jgi:hypothetical protein